MTGPSQCQGRKGYQPLHGLLSQGDHRSVRAGRGYRPLHAGLSCDVEEAPSGLQRGERNRSTLGHKSNEIPDCILGAAIDFGCKDDQKVNIWSLIKHGPGL